MSVQKSSIPCRYFQQGHCWYSDEQCRYSHVLSVRPPIRARDWDFGPGIDNGERYNAKDVKPDSLFGEWRTSWRKPNNIGGGQSSGSSRGRRKKAAEYSEPTFTAAERSYFAKTTAWDETRLDEPGIKSIHFGSEFSVQDTHLAATCSRPSLASSLASLSLGDSDSGNGSWITDRGIIELVHACPSLRVLKLESATSLTDAAFSAVCHACPLLELLRITGNDKRPGSLTASSLKRLTTSPGVATNLRKLVLYDQMSCFMAQVEKLSKARCDLTIETGNTFGDGIADYMVAQMMGGQTTETWLGGKVVSSHTDGGSNFFYFNDDDDGYGHEPAVHSFVMEMGYFPD